MTKTPVRIKRYGHVLETTLARSNTNAIDMQPSRLMGDVLNDFGHDPAHRLALTTGAGEDHFCAGWDLKAAAGGDTIDSIRNSGGLEKAPSAGIILAADRATFELPETCSGIVADAASIKPLKHIPHHNKVEMLFTARWHDAEDATRWGLITRIVSAADQMTRAQDDRPSGLRPAARLRRNQEDGARGRRRDIPRRAEQDNQKTIKDRLTALSRGRSVGLPMRLCRKTRSNLVRQLTTRTPREGGWGEVCGFCLAKNEGQRHSPPQKEKSCRLT